jgi:hypothetical protein
VNPLDEQTLHVAARDIGLSDRGWLLLVHLFEVDDLHLLLQQDAGGVS